MADKEVLKDLLEDEVKDLYSAEKQLLRAIPKMAKGSNDPALQDAFKGHLKETEARLSVSKKLQLFSTLSLQAKNVWGWKGASRKAPKP
jgi:ferritin-like metal-binding protein YciE